MATNMIGRFTDMGVFSDPTLGRVELVHALLNGRDVKSAGATLDIKEPEIKTVSGVNLQVGSYLPLCDYDPDHAIYYGVSHANRLTPALQLSMGILAVVTGKQVVAFGNRTVGNEVGKLTSFQDMKDTAEYGCLSHVVRPEVMCLQALGIIKADFVGYSGGSDKAASAAQMAGFRMKVDNLLAAEPVALHKRYPEHGPLKTVRGLSRLLRDFAATNKDDRLKNAVASAESMAVTQSRGGDSLAKYAAGLLLPANIAIAIGLTKGNSEMNISGALGGNLTMRATIVRGHDSEMVDQLAASGVVSRLREKYPGRVNDLVIPNGVHAMADNPFLQAAWVLEAIGSGTD